MSDIQRQAQATGQPAPSSSIPSKLETAASRVSEQLQSDVPRAMEQAQLSQTGKEVLSDVQRLAADTEKLVREKIEPATAAAQAKMAEVSGQPIQPEAKSIVKEDLKSLMEQFRLGTGDLQHVAKLLLYSQGFRQLTIDLFRIFKDSVYEESLRHKEPSPEDLAELEALIKGKATRMEAGPKYELSEEAIGKLTDRFTAWLKHAHETPEFVDAFKYINDRIGTDWQAVELVRVVLKDPQDLSSREASILEAARQSKAVQVGVGAKTFVETWIGYSLDPLLAALDGLRSAVANDDESIEKAKGLSSFLKRCLTEKMDETRMKDEFKSQLQQLRSSKNKYRQQYEHLIQEGNFVMERMQKEELSWKLTSDLSDLLSHLFLDAQGNLAIKPELWADVKNVLPIFFQRLRFINIDELVIRDESTDFIATGITLSVGELAPKHIQAHFITDLETEEPLTIGEEYDLKSVFVIEASRIFAEARNVAFSLERKTFPTLTDAGIADLAIHGEEGMSLRLTYGARRVSQIGEPEGTIPVGSGGFRLLRVKCTIDELDLRLHESRHSWMYTVLGPLVRRRLKQKIEEAVESYLMKGDWVPEPAAIAQALQ